MRLIRYALFLFAVSMLHTVSVTNASVLRKNLRRKSSSLRRLFGRRRRRAAVNRTALIFKHMDRANTVVGLARNIYTYAPLVLPLLLLAR